MLPSVFELEPPAVAVIALLLLRGPQTVGELRGRADRLYEFSGLGEVQETLDDLAGRSEPLVLKLERQPGQKEARNAHLLSGEIDVEALNIVREQHSGSGASSERVEKLEQEIERLSNEIASFRATFNEFRKQFD